MNILLIEDDLRISAVVGRALTEEGHHVSSLHSGEDAEEQIVDLPYSLVLLDLMLPGRDGWSILRGVRKRRSSTPILVLSARDGVADRVRALDLGADDYLTKPFHLDELLARVRSISRRGPVAEPPRFRAGELLLEPARHRLSRAGEEIPLTRREFVLLELLMRRGGGVVTRRQLIEVGWGLFADTLENTLEFHIHSLRAKIDLPGRGSLIRTVRAVGYRFEA